MTDGGQATVFFKVKFDCGVTSFNDYESFRTEGKRLLQQFNDPNFYYDENPELAGIVTWLISLGSEYYSYKNEIRRND